MATKLIGHLPQAPALKAAAQATGVSKLMRREIASTLKVLKPVEGAPAKPARHDGYEAVALTATGHLHSASIAGDMTRLAITASRVAPDVKQFSDGSSLERRIIMIGDVFISAVEGRPRQGFGPHYRIVTFDQPLVGQPGMRQVTRVESQVKLINGSEDATILSSTKIAFKAGQ